MIIVIERQSLLDIAVQYSGSVLCAFDWAIVNGLSITDNLEPGQKLIVPNSIYKNQDMASYFMGKNHQVATNITNQALEDYSFPGEFPFSF